MSGVAQTKVYRFFPVDTATDISADTIEASLDAGASWWPASLVAPDAGVQAAVAASNPPPRGLTRYWPRVLTGPNENLKPVYGTNRMRIRVTDSPEVPILLYEFFVPAD